MDRRSFFKTLATSFAAAFLPHIEVAEVPEQLVNSFTSQEEGEWRTIDAFPEPITYYYRPIGSHVPRYLE